MYVGCSVCLFNDTPTAKIYTLSLHEALPIFDDCQWADGLTARLLAGWRERAGDGCQMLVVAAYRSEEVGPEHALRALDRKSTRLNSSHANISHAVFCLKKK